jgi:hypothetical protein
MTLDERLESLADRIEAGDQFGGLDGVLREAAEAIESAEWREARMLSRVESADPPFGKGMEIRFIVSAFDLVQAKSPYMAIDYLIGKAQRELHAEADRWLAKSTDLNSADGIGKPRSSGPPHNDEGVPM